jgi:hypothetical protein
LIGPPPMPVSLVVQLITAWLVSTRISSLLVVRLITTPPDTTVGLPS